MTNFPHFDRFKPHNVQLFKPLNGPKSAPVFNRKNNNIPHN